MDKLIEKVSYLKGLYDGLSIDKDTNEGKVFSQIIEVLDEITGSIGDLYETQENLEEYITYIDEDLFSIEEVLFDDDDYDDMLDDYDDMSDDIFDEDYEETLDEE